jgi:hypothetical protein
MRCYVQPDLQNVGGQHSIHVHRSTEDRDASRRDPNIDVDLLMLCRNKAQPMKENILGVLNVQVAGSAMHKTESKQFSGRE